MGLGKDGCALSVQQSGPALPAGSLGQALNMTHQVP